MSTNRLHPKQQAAEYDFVVVGSGAGGGPLACNLAKRGFRVLVLEAGGWDEPEVSNVPALHAHATEDPDLSWEFFVKHYAAPKETDTKWDAARKGVFYPRAATVGGCTVHNAMITICGPTGDWHEIAGLTGDDSWSGERMRAYFERLEVCDYVPHPATRRPSLREKIVRQVEHFLGVVPDVNPGRHGFAGWLRTTMADPKLVANDDELFGAILGALRAAKAAGIERLDALLGNFVLGKIAAHFDPNHWETLENSPEGLALIPVAVHGGQRNGPRDYLRQVQKEHPDRLTIQTNTLVAQVLFDGEPNAPGLPGAIGVRVLRGKHLYKAHPEPKGGGKEEEIYCRREVILCGGAYNTPQLLKLSGLGPPAELQKFRIPVRVPLAGVGMNLQDRYEVGIVWEMNKDFALLKGLNLGVPKPGEPADSALMEWREKKTGLYATNGVLLGLLKKSRPDLAAPDLFIFAMPGYFKGYYKGYSKEIAKGRNFLTWAILTAHTKNRGGTVMLRSADPRDVPEINFHYFHEGTDVQGEDLAALVEGVKFVREMNRHASGVVKRELWPGGDATDDDTIRRFVGREAWGHHASCSCPIGADGDPMAVLDSRFRVRGTRNLRVVDASVFPRIPGLFLATSIYMVSEKASDAIAEDHRE